MPAGKAAASTSSSTKTPFQNNNTTDPPPSSARDQPSPPSFRVVEGDKGTSPISLPYSANAEMGVLGSILQDPEGGLMECGDKLAPEFFYRRAHQTIYALMLKMADSGQAIDTITIVQNLNDQGTLEAIGGAPYITHLYTFVPSAANLSTYLTIVREKYLLRQMIGVCERGIQRCHGEQDEIDKLLDSIEKDIFAVNENRFQEKSQDMKTLVMQAIDQIELTYTNRGSIGGVPTGFKELDQMLDGMHESELIILAARPSMGKTSLAMNIAEHVAVDKSQPVAVFSLEMSAQQLVQRLLFSRARIKLQRSRDGFLSNQDLDKLTRVAGEFRDAPMFIDDTSGLTVQQIRAKSRRLKASHDIQLIVVDYLQLCRSPQGRQESRQLEITDVSAGLKGLAKELEIPVLCLAQLNRNPEGRKDGRPMLSDLRESGSIEQDADVVMLLVRPDYYRAANESKDDDTGGAPSTPTGDEAKAEIIIAKQRNGPTGEVELVFLDKYTRFEDPYKGP